MYARQILEKYWYKTSAYVGFLTAVIEVFLRDQAQGTLRGIPLKTTTKKPERLLCLQPTLAAIK